MPKKLKVEPVEGWFLIALEEVPNDEDMSKAKFGTRWHVAWLEPFGTKKGALEFAKRHNWYQPFKAVRGCIAITA